jgi:cytochrome c-type biogenesis protein CcmH
MKRLAILLAFLASVMGAAPVFAVPVADTFANPATEARARALQRQLRCLVCQGESIDESNASLAADLRHLVRQQIADGRSDAQIQDYLVARYGDFILMKPPLQPDTWLLWLGPFLVLLGGGAVAVLVIGKARRAQGTDSP